LSSLKEYAFTFCPISTISLVPFLINSLASLSICSNGREHSGPLVNGTTQKLQNLLQPSWIVKKEDMLLFLFLILFK